MYNRVNPLFSGKGILERRKERLFYCGKGAKMYNHQGKLSLGCQSGSQKGGKRQPNNLKKGTSLGNKSYKINVFQS